MGVQGGNQGAPGVPDPINALQTLAIQGTRNPLMNMGGPQQTPMGATGLLQNLTRAPPQSIQQNMLPRPNMGMGQNGGPMSQQMGQIQSQLGGQIPNNGINQLPNQLAAQMQPVQNQLQAGPMQIGNQIQSQIQNQMLGQMQASKPMMMNAPNSAFPRNPTPNQFLSQSPSPNVQSPAGLGGATPGNQMVASPALAPSPSSQMGMLGGGGGPPR